MNYEKLFSQLKRHEGLRLCAYKCPAGYWTVGYGRNLETNGLSDTECFLIFRKSLSNKAAIEALKEKPLTGGQADMLLTNDVSNVEENCYRVFDFRGHNDARRAAIINMVFQMGMGGVLAFKNTIRAFESHDYAWCAKEMLDSKWFKKDSPGRAQELSDQMFSGEWQ